MQENEDREDAERKDPDPPDADQEDSTIEEEQEKKEKKEEAHKQEFDTEEDRSASKSAEMEEVSEDEEEARTWAMFAHLASLAGWIGVPFGNILGPLIVWLIKKDEMDFVDDQGKEALNFQIAMTVYGLVAFLLIFVFIGFVLLPLLLLADIILTVFAAVKAKDGEKYRYPFIFRVI